MPHVSEGLPDLHLWPCFPSLTRRLHCFYRAAPSGVPGPLELAARASRRSAFFALMLLNSPSTSLISSSDMCSRPTRPVRALATARRSSSASDGSPASRGFGWPE